MKYRKLQSIGSGSFGEVFKAKAVGEKGQFALKQLLKSATEFEKKRFIREVRIQAKLKHKNIVPILHYDLQSDPPRYVMPLATSNLKDQLRRLAKNKNETFAVFKQILEGVGECRCVVTGVICHAESTIRRTRKALGDWGNHLHSRLLGASLKMLLLIFPRKGNELSRHRTICPMAVFLNFCVAIPSIVNGIW